MIFSSGTKSTLSRFLDRIIKEIQTIRPNALIAGSGLAAFRYREYRFFWLAAAFSNIGMWALIYGRLWLMHDLTNSPLMVGLVTTSTLGPVLLFSLLGGVIADRVNRLKLIRSTRAMFAVPPLTTGILITTNIIEPWHLIILSLSTGLLLAFDIPSRSAMIPNLVPRDHLASAIALYSLVFGGASIVGPAMFAPLVELWGMEGVFFLIGISYVLTVIALSFMNPDRHKPQTQSSTMLQGLMEGLEYVRKHRIIQGIIILGMVVGAFGASLETLLPIYSDKIITGGINTYSRLLLSAGIGGLIATISITILGTLVRPVWFYVVSGVISGCGLLILSSITSFPMALLTLGIIGASRGIFGTMSSTLIQSLSADQFRGRVMSLHQFTWGTTALGGILIGAMGEGIGINLALGFSGFMIMVTTLLIALTVLRRLLRYPTANVHSDS